jgi:hypothetical protein
MRRRLALSSSAFALVVVASACSQSASDRARKAALRARDEASARESETVQRLATPQDPHRILYHAPTDLSYANAQRTGAAIVGIDKVPQPTEPPVHSGAPPVKPPR